MLIKTRNIQAGASLMHLTDLSVSDAKFFGQPQSSTGSKTLIGITGDIAQSVDGFVEFETSEAVLLNLGSGPEVFLVSLGSGQKNFTRNAANYYAASLDGNSAKNGTLLDNDNRFLQACSHENIPNNIQVLAKKLLEDIRTYSDDTLIEGKNRKWYTKPKNFIAITIQNTKRRLCIQVKNSSILSSLKEVDVHYDKRYVRLFLEVDNQLHDAIKAVKASFQQC